MRHNFLCATILIGVVFVAGKSGADDAKKDSEKIQGLWAAVTYVQDGDGGEEPGPPAESPIKWSFKDKKITLLTDVEEGHPTGSFKLDPSKTPKTIDLTFPPAPGDKKDQTILGIYKFDGDTFTICYQPDQGKRPTEFKSKAGSKTILAAFKPSKFLRC